MIERDGDGEGEGDEGERLVGFAPPGDAREDGEMTLLKVSSVGFWMVYPWPLNLPGLTCGKGGNLPSVGPMPLRCRENFMRDPSGWGMGMWLIAEELCLCMRMRRMHTNLRVASLPLNHLGCVSVCVCVEWRWRR